MDQSRRLVAVWKTSWLPSSETFIRNQLGALNQWDSAAVGIRRVSSPLSRESDRVLYDAPSRLGRFQIFVLEKTGFSTRLRKFLRSTNPDVIQAHFGNGAMIVRREAKRARIPFVVTLHGSDITAGPSQKGIAGLYYRARLRKVFRDAALLLPVSNFLASRAVVLGADPKKVVVHHIGIPLRSGEPQPDVSRAILAVGRMTEKKGFEHLIRALAMIPGGVSDVPVTIVGDGPLMGSLKALASQLDVSVSFRGFLPSDEVRDLMSRRPIVCLPSIVASNGDQEGLPTVAMEAAAEGCPIVAYQHSGMPDIVEHGRNGVLVPEGNVAALAKAIDELLRQPAAMRRMGDAGLSKVRAEFDINHQTELLERQFARAVSRR